MSIKEKYQEIKKEYIKEYSEKLWNQEALWKFEIFKFIHATKTKMHTSILWGKLCQLLPPYQMAGIFGANVEVTFLSSKNPFNYPFDNVTNVKNETIYSNISVLLPFELTNEEKGMMHNELKNYSFPCKIDLSNTNFDCKSLNLELQQLYCQSYNSNVENEPFKI